MAHGFKKVLACSFCGAIGYARQEPCPTCAKHNRSRTAKKIVPELPKEPTLDALKEANPAVLLPTRDRISLLAQ